jgi:hypothetical protein
MYGSQSSHSSAAPVRECRVVDLLFPLTVSSILKISQLMCICQMIQLMVVPDAAALDHHGPSSLPNDHAS